MFYFVVEVGKTYFKLPVAISLRPSSCVVHQASTVNNCHYFFKTTYNVTIFLDLDYSIS